ncbi:MAG TPA: Fe3+/spermidine/putrescine ABC transporter ATP-binding protein [Planctomycetes bacterium]|nr:Fe3+/spermidine/putrescine ABC transporter ATP-binding protein [Planctomycetota bacterium]
MTHPPADGRPLDLAIRAIDKAFGSVQVLRGLSLDIPDGQFVTLLGPSGCGKTTLLRIIAGFEAPDRGTVTLGAVDLLALPAHKRPVNTVFQSYALFPHLRCEDNVAFGLRSRRIPEAELRPRVREAMETMRITEFARRYPHELSGGQRQRVALARALVNEPEVLLLDEPMSALDAKLRHEVQGELKRIQRKYQITFILVTHDQDEAIAVSDRILIMQDGGIAQDGTPEQVYERPVSRFVAEFMGSANLLPARCAGTPVAVCGFGELHLPAPATWSEGHLAIRPEDIEVRQAQPAVNGVAGRISERLFRGDHWELLVTLGDSSTLRITTEPDQHHSEGEAVWLELPPDDLLVLRD